jgi:crossover junction endodeoxyribonuclease RuvC
MRCWPPRPPTEATSTFAPSLLARVERVFVLGIDPGLSRCGYGVVRQYGSDLTAMAGGVVTTEPDLPLQERLRVLFTELRALVVEMRPDAVVVERVFFQTNVRTAMATGQAGGVALLVAAEAGCEVAQYSANEVKQAVVGFGGATKDQVQRMVAALLGLSEPPRPPDVADALALAVCHLTAQPLRRAIEAAGSGRRP